MPSPGQLWPEPARFSSFTPVIEPDRVGQRLANGHGPVLEQNLLLLWGKATPLIICPDTWQLEVKESREEETFELKWMRVSCMNLERGEQRESLVERATLTSCQICLIPSHN